MFVSLIARMTPVVKRIGSWRLGDFLIGGIPVTKVRLFPGFHGDRRSVIASLAFTLPNRHFAGVAVRIHVDTVFARSPHGERRIRRINFVSLTVHQMTNPQAQRTLMQLQLSRVIADASQSQAAFAAHANHTTTYVQFGARVFVSPDVIGTGKRAIHDSSYPIAGALGLNGDRT